MSDAVRTPAALRAAFERHVGRPATALVRAPGRVNLIGEHTDTSDGFVLPMAIDREVRLALAPRTDGRVRLVALDVVGADGAPEVDVFDVDAPHARDGWAAYAHGVAWALAEAGRPLVGFDAVVTGDVPRGAGLSSSAALELAVARAFHEAAVQAAAEGRGAAPPPWDAKAMAVACRRAENAWVGVASGVMDQLVCAAAEAGSALWIDCRTLDTAPAPLPAGARVVILDTGTRRGLVGSAYNERRAQVDAAAAALGVTVLRDASEADLAAHAPELEDAVRRRARHVIRENARVHAATEAMAAGDAAALGELMNASHASLRDDFEVTGPALDAMTEVAQAHPGCFGARMTGAGFAGCCVALVDEAQLEGFLHDVAAAYAERTGETPALYPVRGAAGAGPLDEPGG